jgi:hypothetical protein
VATHFPKLPKLWYVVLAITFIAGVVLLCCQPIVPSVVQQLSSKVKPDAWSVLIGIYLVSVVVTNLILFKAMRWLHILFDLHGSDSLADIWASTFVGLCENVMYPTALLVDKSEFIGLWLALKTAAGWVRWTGAGTGEHNNDMAGRNEARRHFNRFLVGNALSIMAAIVTYGSMKMWVLS